jgi:hypothetical protein
MRAEKLLLTSLCLIVLVSVCCGQVRKSAKSAGYSVPKVGASKAKIMCPIFTESQYPYQGFGFKMGDPFALTYKFYPNKHLSFALDGGTSASGLYNSYYRGHFGDYAQLDTLSTDPNTQTKSQVTYLSHKVTSDWFVEVKALYQWPAEKISKGLQLYGGIGWQWRDTSITYDYNFEGYGKNKFGKIFEDRLTYGLTTIIGFEYSYFSLPISAFIEMESYFDLNLDPGYQRYQGGVGLRYVF